MPADYQPARPDGAVHIEADDPIETDDPVAIPVRNVGTIVPPRVSRVSGAGDKDHPEVRITVCKVGG